MKKSKYHYQVVEIARSIEVVDDMKYTISGEIHRVKYQHAYSEWNKPLESFGQNEGEESKLKSNLTNHLAESLYRIYYVRGTSKFEKHPEFSGLPPQEERNDFMNELVKWNHTSEHFDAYWNVYQTMQDGSLFVRKDGRLRMAQPGTFERGNLGNIQLPDHFIHFKVIKESRQLQPAFYHVFSNELFPQESKKMRLYFNARPKFIGELIEFITKSLNKYKIPFQFKCLNHPKLYTRTDSSVLYFDISHINVITILLNQEMVNLKKYLKKGVPLFSKRIAKGIGLAEDPGKGQSFGMSRCQLIAKACVNSFYYNKKIEDQFVIDEIRDSGYDISNFYKEPNSHWSYEYLY